MNRFGDVPPVPLLDRICTLRRPLTPLTELTWTTLPWVFRYTGGSVADICRLESTAVQLHEGVMGIEIGQRYRRRVLPVHARLRPHLERLVRERQGRLFFDVGRHPHKKNWTVQGYVFRQWWLPLAQAVWPPMVLSSWRAGFFDQLCRIPDLPVATCAWLVGVAVPPPWPEVPPPERWQQAVKAITALP